MEKKILIVYTVLYLIANITLLLNNGVFWDDWVLYDSASDRIAHIFEKGIGSVGLPVWWFHLFFVSIPFAPFLYHLIIFISSYLIGLLLWGILIKINIFDKYEQLIIVLLFTFVPYNSAKITMICSLYSLSLLVFFVAFWSLLQYAKTVGYWRVFFRIIALTLFYLSFTTNSLLVFYCIPIICMMLIEQNYSFSYLAKKIIRNIDFFALPFIFWGVKKILLPPAQGAYQGYNEINKNILTEMPSLVGQAFNKSIYYFVVQFKEFLISNFSKFLFVSLFLGLFFILFYLFTHLKKQKIAPNYKLKLPALFMGGILILFIGAFPYLAVSKIPDFIDYESRHQLLLNLGLALSLSAIILLFRKYILISHALTSFVCAYFLLINLFFQLDYLKLHFKQEALMKEFKQEKQIGQQTTFLIEDKTPKYIETVTRHYTYTGMLHKLFGTTNKFMAEEWDYKSLEKNYTLKKYIEHSGTDIKAENYIVDDAKCTVTITNGSIVLDNITTIKLLYYSYFDSLNYQNSLDNLLVINITLPI